MIFEQFGVFSLQNSCKKETNSMSIIYKNDLKTKYTVYCNVKIHKIILFSKNLGGLNEKSSYLC